MVLQYDQTWAEIFVEWEIYEAGLLGQDLYSHKR